MKKLTYLILGALIILAPFTASALEALNVDSMKAATGQAGVTIGIDDVILYQDTGDVTYRDNDGDGTTVGDVGGIKITGNESLLFINAIITGAGAETRTGSPDYATMIADSGTGVTFAAAPLTIDVGLCANLTAIAGGTGNEIGGVIIGLPTLEIHDALPNKSQIISFEESTATNNGFEYIEILSAGSTMAILGGTIEIAPH